MYVKKSYKSMQCVILCQLHNKNSQKNCRQEARYFNAHGIVRLCWVRVYRLLPCCRHASSREGTIGRERRESKAVVEKKRFSSQLVLGWGSCCHLQLTDNWRVLDAWWHSSPSLRLPTRFLLRLVPHCTQFT